jgi:hypothetical protein
MALTPSKIKQLKAEAREALAQLDSPESVLIFDFSTGIAQVAETAATRSQVSDELQKQSISILKLKQVFKRPDDRIYYAIAGKAKEQGLTIAEYVEEFAVQYREIGLPVFFN